MVKDSLEKVKTGNIRILLSYSDFNRECQR